MHVSEGRAAHKGVTRAADKPMLPTWDPHMVLHANARHRRGTITADATANVTLTGPVTAGTIALRVEAFNSNQAVLSYSLATPSSLLAVQLHTGLVVTLQDVDVSVTSVLADVVVSDGIENISVSVTINIVNDTRCVGVACDNPCYAPGACQAGVCVYTSRSASILDACNTSMCDCSADNSLGVSW